MEMEGIHHSAGTVSMALVMADDLPRYAVIESETAMTEERAGRRSGGRADRVAKRALPPATNPCAPGQIGGAYKPLSESDLRAIYDTTLKLLAELGHGRSARGA